MLCKLDNTKLARHCHIVRATKPKAVRCAGTSFQMICSKEGYSVAYERSAPAVGSNFSPALLFCNGLLSDRSGKKAILVKQLGNELGCEVVLYDARAHGDTPGHLAELGIADWLADAQLVLDEVVTSHRVVVIGSSLGGWVASLLAVSRPARVAGLLLIAPAIDISEHHWKYCLTTEDKRLGWATGLFPLQSPYVSTVAPVTSQHALSTPLLTAKLTEGTPHEFEETVLEASNIDVAANEFAGKDGSQHQDDTSAIRHEPGAVMLGLNFFIQGRQLLLVHDKSQFEVDWEQQSKSEPISNSLSSKYEHQQGQRDAGQCTTRMTDKSSVCGIPEVIEKRLAVLSSMPVIIMHGTDDDCVPIGISFQLMQALSEKVVISNCVDVKDYHDWMLRASSSGFDVTQTTMTPDDVGMDDGCPKAQSLYVSTRLKNHAQQLYVIEGGDHRLSGPMELRLLSDLVTTLVKWYPSNLRG